MSIAAILQSIGLGQYAEAFAAADVDASVLPLLTEEDLKDLGLSLGHRRKLLAAIADGSVAAALAQLSAAAVSPNPLDHANEPERRQITVLFCDIVGSSALTERLDPEEMGRIIRRFQDTAAGAISRFDGFVDRFMGDGVLAFFGFPRAHEDAAERAVRAGLAIIETVTALFTPSGDPIAVRVAVASGPVFIGEVVAHGGAREHIVTGEVLNLAARLQNIAPVNGLAVSRETERLLRGLFEVEDLGLHEFKGIGRPIRVWSVLRERVAPTRFEAAFGQAIAPMVGRDAEIAILKERWKAATLGEGQAVLLSGEAGMGKSRIAQALHEHIQDQPHIIVRYQCSPFHRNSALYPAIAQMQFAAGIAATDPPEVKLAKLKPVLAQSGSDVEAVLPVFASLLGIPSSADQETSPVSAEELKRRTLQALVDQLLGLSRQRPVFMLLEDAHWLDPTSYQLMGEAIGSIADSRVLLLATFRPEFQHGWAGLAHVTSLALSRLPSWQAQGIIDHVGAGKSFPPELVQQILLKTDGVPLFVEELAKTILDLGVLREEGDRYILTRPLPSLAIPSTLQDSLMARLDRHPSAKEIAQLGAVIGREFPHTHISALSGLEGAQLLDAVRELLRSELVHQRGGLEHAIYVFKHAMVQETAYHTLVNARREQLHLHCAQILLELTPGIAEQQPELLAHHYEAGHDYPAAAGYWLKAGRRAAERSASVEAVAHLRHGLTAAAQITEAEQRAELEMLLNLELGVPLIATRGYAAPETIQAWETARALSEDRSDRHFARALYGLWAARISLGETRTALGLASRLVELGAQMQDEGIRIVGHRVRGLTYQTLGEVASARSELDAALTLYDPTRHSQLGLEFGQNPRVSAMASLSIVLWLQGFPDRARATSLAAVAEATEAKHANSIGYALAYGACLVGLLRCDPVETAQLADQLIALAEERHFELWQAYGRSYKGWALARSGDAVEAVRLLRLAQEGFSRAGSELYAPTIDGLLGYALRHAGQPQEALVCMSRAVAEAEKREEVWCLPELLRQRAALLRQTGEIEAAAANAARAIEIATQAGLLSPELRCTADIAAQLRRQGRNEDAAALLTPLIDRFTEGWDTPDLRWAMTLAGRSPTAAGTDMTEADPP